MNDPAALLRHLWWVGVASVSGRRAVANALAHDGHFAADRVVAVGKAACSMFLGAQSCMSPSTKSVIVSKYRHIDAACRTFPHTDIIESGHPMPDENSLVAGDRVLRAVSDAGPEDRLLLLVSGGASALAEALAPGRDLAELRAVNSSLLASGKSIAEINVIRSRLSLIKDGGLLGRFRGKEVRVYALSDVQGDRLPPSTPFPHTTILRR
jgi:hydroxypyruvate reductase